MEEGTENLTSNTGTETLNITGHTSVINSIEHLGENPDHWLLALRELEQIENGPRKRKSLKHFFIQSGKILKSASLWRNCSYATLLGKEALFQGEIDAGNARSAFKIALTLCPLSPVIYVMFAQFELNQGRSNKAIKILKHGEICVEDRSEISAARKKLEQACRGIDGSRKSKNVSPLQNITNAFQFADIQSQKHSIPVSNSKDIAPSKFTSHENLENHKKFSQTQFKDQSVLCEALPSSPAAPFFSQKISSVDIKSEPHPPVITKTLTPKNQLISVGNDATPQVIELNSASNNKALQTPPPLKICAISKALHLGLNLQSPAAPDLSFLSHKKPLYSRSNLTSDNLSISQAQPIIPQSIVTASNHNFTASTQSEKKCLPMSRTMKIIPQTTSKLLSHVQSKGAPRRVLISNTNTSIWSDSDSDSGDVKPLEKSPDDVRKNPFNDAKPTLKGKAICEEISASQSTNKENKWPGIPCSNTNEPDHRLHGEDASRQAFHASAFHSYLHTFKQERPVPVLHKTKPQNPVEQSTGISSNCCPEQPNQKLETSQMTHNSVMSKNVSINGLHEVNMSQQSALGQRQQSFVPNNKHNGESHPPNHQPVQYEQSQDRPNHQPVQYDSSKHPHNHQPVKYDQSRDAPNNQPVRYDQSNYSQPHHDAHYNIHPALKKFHEKKILEINGASYILLKILGKGGSSKVFQALNTETYEISAIKQVNLAGCESSVLEGYKNEIQFLKRLQGNRYIIKLIDYEVRENHLYLVMECGSLDLSGFLKKQKVDNEKLQMTEIYIFWKNMLKAVETIHKYGVIHLDLKPANFMIVDYSLKLIDFGIANSINADATSIIKDTQFGTLNYMAPETINDMSGGVPSGGTYTPKFKVGPKADVWSLGCILYYMMYGKTPFQHIQRQVLKLFAITNENHDIEFPDFPRQELIEIVKACLTRDPKKRPSVEMLLTHPLFK